jgi:hypothetical protein
VEGKLPFSAKRGLWSKRTKTYGKHKNDAEIDYQKHFLLVLSVVFPHYQKFMPFVLLIISVVSRLSEAPLSGKCLSVQNRPVTPKTPTSSLAKFLDSQVERDSLPAAQNAICRTPFFWQYATITEIGQNPTLRFPPIARQTPSPGAR